MVAQWKWVVCTFKILINFCLYLVVELSIALCFVRGSVDFKWVPCVFVDHLFRT